MVRRKTRFLQRRSAGNIEPEEKRRRFYNGPRSICLYTLSFASDDRTFHEPYRLMRLRCRRVCLVEYHAQD